jgi:hypothetical protein
MTELSLRLSFNRWATAHTKILGHCSPRARRWLAQRVEDNEKVIFELNALQRLEQTYDDNN